jgi:DNA-directed RNA polymerase subunit RPC12/RpoP
MRRQDCNVEKQRDGTCPFYTAGGGCRLCKEARDQFNVRISEGKGGMTMEVIFKKSGFANGYDYLCAKCLTFFSAQVEGNVNHCPHCGMGRLITSTEALEEIIWEKGLDPAEFDDAFSHTEKEGA